MKNLFKIILLTLILSLSGCTWFADADCTKLGQLSCRHELEWEIKGATCQAGGYTVQGCKKCGYELESSKKDRTPIRDHTILDKCGFCGLDYFDNFTKAFKERNTVQHNEYSNTWTENNVVNSNDIYYNLTLTYIEQTAPVFTLAVERVSNYMLYTLTLTITDANGVYGYTYVSEASNCAGLLYAQNTTDSTISFDVTNTNMSTTAQILANDLINIQLRAAITALKTMYFPPNLGFTIKHFGFDKL